MGIRKSGWLQKRGGRIQTWHKRWFVLTGDMIFYYKNQHDDRPTGTIPLAGNKVKRYPDDPKQPNMFKFEIEAGDNKRVISSTHDTYLMSAESAEAADQWVATIRRVMHEPYGGGMFGRSLEETLQVEARLGGSYIPVFVHRCASFIREHGLREVGIFRLPGQSSRIQALKELYDQGSQNDFSDTEEIHSVSSLLKLYFRELPEPLIPYSMYYDFCKATELFESNSEAGMNELKSQLGKLPKANFNVLKYISRFLYEVQSHSDENKMNCRNLGMVFGHNMLKPKTDDPQVLMERNNNSTDFMSAMISHHEDLFPITADEKPAKRLSVIVPPSAVEEPAWQENAMVTNRSLHSAETRTFFRSRKNSAPSSMLKNPTEANHKSSMEPHPKTELSSSNQSPLSTLVPMSGSSKHSSSSSRRGTVTTCTLASDKKLLITEEDETELGELSNKLSALMDGLNHQPPPQTAVVAGHSDAISNHMTREVGTLETQLFYIKEELLRYKKAARLWKTRYEQEKRARHAAEERIQDLQWMIEDTFGQFAIDDSEDDFEEGSPDDVMCNGEGLDSSKVEKKSLSLESQV